MRGRLVAFFARPSHRAAVVSSSIDQKLLVDFVFHLLSPGRITLGGLATRRAGALHRRRVAPNFEPRTLT